MSSKLFQWHSLKTRVTFFTLVVFVLGIWSLGFYISSLLKDDMQRVLGDQQFSTAAFIAAEVNGELTDGLAALELIAKEIDAQLMDNPAVEMCRAGTRCQLPWLLSSSNKHASL